MQKYLTNPTAGIKIIGYFALWALFSEALTIYLGGDWGGFLWVTFHFILNPILGGIIILIVIWHSLKQSIPWLKAVTIFSCIAPLVVIYMAYTGSLWIYDVLDVNFQ